MRRRQRGDDCEAEYAKESLESEVLRGHSLPFALRGAPCSVLSPSYLARFDRGYPLIWTEYPVLCGGLPRSSDERAGLIPNFDLRNFSRRETILEDA